MKLKEIYEKLQNEYLLVETEHGVATLKTSNNITDCKKYIYVTHFGAWANKNNLQGLKDIFEILHIKDIKKANFKFVDVQRYCKLYTQVQFNNIKLFEIL